MSQTRLRQGLRGIVHAHSTRSFDGHCDYAALRTLFRGAGLDFACMTEHIEYLTQDDIDAVFADCEAHSDDEFLFVPGIEMDCFTVYFLGVRAHRVDFSSNEAIYRGMRAHARLCVLSHPIKARFQYPDWILADCDAVEIMNNKHDGKFYFRPQSERLLARIRGRRPEVAAVVGMDFHEPRQLCPIHMRIEDAGPLRADFVLDALAQGRVAFHDGARRLDRLSAPVRTLMRARIHLMDGAHLVHRTLRRSGLRVPRPLRRALARALEGG